jgi:L-iditol 2-dehydrogenase
MIAVVFEGREQMQVTDLPAPECGPGEVLLQVAACGICGGDARSYFHGDANTGTRRIPGHEMCGIVAESRNPRFRRGDRLALAADVHCGECWFCLRELFNLCDSHRVLGKHMNGGLADYMLLTQQILTYGIVNSVPEGLPLLHAGVSEPLCSVLATHDDLRIETGETVLIVGSGPMGILHLELLRARGARVILMARTHSRLDRARDDSARSTSLPHPTAIRWSRFER